MEEEKNLITDAANEYRKNHIKENYKTVVKTLIENAKVILAPISNDYQAEKNNKKIIEKMSKRYENCRKLSEIDKKRLDKTSKMW